MAEKGLLSSTWWLLALRGILLLFLGAGFIFHPIASMAGAVWIIGLFWFFGGIFTLVGLFFNREAFWAKVISGLLSVVVGAWIAFPGTVSQAVGNAFAFKGAIALIWAAIALLAGILMLIEGFQTKDWADGLFGAFLLLFGIYLLLNASEVMEVLPLILGIFAIVAGITSLFLAFRARSLGKTVDTLVR
ncbi:MAG: DUF308 domain-containing protein [Coriobacteriia bacterium]|nr:DUF308 domain-containing protein [Coriobacteriia bacterium]